MKRKKIVYQMGYTVLLFVLMLGLQGCRASTTDTSGDLQENTVEDTQLEEEDSTTGELTDTVRWFNASYAVLTELNGWDYNRFAGLPANKNSAEINKDLLKEWWDTTDRASADETLEWILTEGHRTDFVENMKYMEENGLGQVSLEERGSFLEENFGLTSKEAAFIKNGYDRYEKYGEHAISGWDYCRAMNLLGFFYLAEYYTEEEALDKSLEIAQIMQPLFESWDDLIDSYLCGYEYWSVESSDERRAVYEDLKGREDSPYKIDYHLVLEKTW